MYVRKDEMEKRIIWAEVECTVMVVVEPGGSSEEKGELTNMELGIIIVLYHS